MIDASLERLSHLIAVIPTILRRIGEEELARKPLLDKWSKKEILGHLIDSASNNHQRFIRVQFEDIPWIAYDQNQWNRASRYKNMECAHLISFWALYNKHLLEILRQIPCEALSRQCRIGQEQLVTLEFIINDYLRHLEHHLHQMADY
jgi:hypothetical protein